MTDCDVAIIGAGPYGLSAAAHLRTIKGLDLCIFGDPMSFWERHMPARMLLRSGWAATHIAHPERGFALESFQQATGARFSRPVPIEHFVRYGQWYQRHAVPFLDRRKVSHLEHTARGFTVTLDDGERLSARRVVVACGIQPFAWCPPEFQSLPPALATHTSAHRDLGTFTGKKVLVVGGGQSALESAALLNEAGAEVEVIVRSRRIHWLQGWASTALHWRLGKVTSALLYAPTDVGPAGVSQLLARPDLVRQLPRVLLNKLWKRAVRPAGAGWLRPRLAAVPIRLGRSVASAVPRGGRVKVRLSDGTELDADHILLGTGFRVDISNYAFLDRALVRSIRCVRGYPLLKPGLETSVSRLHILGAPAAWSFGPLMQFVSGARYASESLLRAVTPRTATAHGCFPLEPNPTIEAPSSPLELSDIS